MWSVAAVALALVVGHNRSEGSSRFVVGERDVQIEVTLLKLDLPELCEVDLSFSDAARREAEAQRLRQCVEVGMPRWLRLQVQDGDGVCVTAPGDVDIGDDMTVTFRSRAACGPLPGHTLVIDWGFFAGQGLDHLSKVSVVIGDHVDRGLLSSRQRKLKVKVPARGPSVAVVGGLGAAVVVVAVIADLFIRRRRRQTGSEQAR